MEIARYRPGLAIQWLDDGPERIKDESIKMAQSVFRREGARSVGRDVREVAGALWKAGAAAMAELSKRKAEATEFVFDKSEIRANGMGSTKVVPYSQIRRIMLKGDECLIELERGSLTIKPFAHIVAGQVKVPVGWTRNGVEVPYELIIEELVARSGIEVQLV